MPDQFSRRSLAEKLNLPFNENMQDWEYEVANSKRLPDFISEYEKPETTNNEQACLMEIILDSLNDLLIEDAKTNFDLHFDAAIALLMSNIQLHRGTLYYWCKNDFEISFYLRRYAYSV